MSNTLKTGLAVAALAVTLGACNDPVAEPEPANEGVAAEMPQTPDMGAASEAAAGTSATAPATGAATDQPQTATPSPAG
jgi:hypothetical protein